MGRPKHEGTCHLCGSNGPLSFEHVPPRAAFNNKRVIAYRFEDVIELGPDASPRGPISQRGAGAYTLCSSCNNKTGSWYGPKFIDWCYQGMDILLRSGGHPTLIYLNYLYPLPILKQIITMFFSVNPPTFAAKNEDLVRFILNKETRHLPPRILSLCLLPYWRWAPLHGGFSKTQPLQTRGQHHERDFISSIRLSAHDQLTPTR